MAVWPTFSMESFHVFKHRKIKDNNLQLQWFELLACTYLSSVYIQRKLLKMQFCTIPLDKHTREQPNATTSDSHQVNVWDKRHHFPCSGSFLIIYREMHWKSCSHRTTSLHFQNNELPCFSENEDYTLEWFTMVPGSQAHYLPTDNNYSLYFGNYNRKNTTFLDTVSKVLDWIYRHIAFI